MQRKKRKYVPQGVKQIVTKGGNFEVGLDFQNEWQETCQAAKSREREKPVPRGKEYISNMSSVTLCKI